MVVVVDLERGEVGFKVTYCSDEEFDGFFRWIEV